MVPALNVILFMLSTLFGLNTVFVAERTNLVLDFGSKTGSIEYFNLMAPVQVVDYAKVGLQEIDKKTEFFDGYIGLKLISKTFEEKDGRLNASLNFSFTDQSDILELLRFNQTQKGQDTPPDAIYYHLLPAESLIASDGNQDKKQDDVVLSWSADTKTIELDLGQKANARELLGEMKSIAGYWTK